MPLIEKGCSGLHFNPARKEVIIVNDKNQLEELAAALNGHEVTNDEGQIEDQTSGEDQADLEQKEPEVNETTTSEKTEESTETETHSADDDSEPNAVEDEKGKRYIPEKRFEKVYGEKKALERRLKDLEAKALLNQPMAIKPNSVSPEVKPIDKTDLLEIELLKGKLPQFDPESDQYSEELDNLGAEILAANPNLTRFDAAKKAISYAKRFAGDVAKVQAEARLIKTSQSDQGITSRVINRQESSNAPGDNASADEIEKWLKANGAW